MANTLTNLINTIYEARDKVSRELVGFIPAVMRDTAMERAAKDQPIRVPITQSQTASDITPAVTPPDDGDQTISNASVTISSARRVPIRWNGKDTRGMQNSGIYGSSLADQFAQAMRTLVNEIETDIAELYVKASRAYGTAGTTPFGTAGEFDDAAEVMRILDDNGAPQQDRQLVLSSAAKAKLLGFQTNLQRVNEAGSPEAFERGILPPVHGFTLRSSAQCQSHTKGTATGFDANGGEPVGETSIVCDGSDAGTILAGDIVTWAGDSNKYVVASGGTLTGNATGSLTLAEPGLREALADTVEGTIGNSYTANMAFHRDALVLVARAPELPEGGDSADDRMMIMDPVSGLPFEVAVYRQYRQVQYEVSMAWGVACIKPEHLAILLG